MNIGSEGERGTNFEFRVRRANVEGIATAVRAVVRRRVRRRGIVGDGVFFISRRFGGVGEGRYLGRRGWLPRWR